MNDLLFTPFTLGGLSLKNRVVMAPLTRSRCVGNVPSEMVATYYSQRCEAGLIVTEATSPSPNGLGYPRIPALYSDSHVQKWQAVTDAVHARDGKIFVQLMHTGRVGHPLNLPSGGCLLAPSAIANPGTMFTDQAGEQPFPVPSAMSEGDIEQAIAEFTRAAELAMRAGFDGVELHGANGYLIEQFLNTASNQRNDRWGGSIQGRARFAIAVARRVAGAIGAQRLGMRLSPFGGFNNMRADALMHDLFAHLARELSAIGLVYLHIVDLSSTGLPPVPPSTLAAIRGKFGKTIILSGGFTKQRAAAALAAGTADMIAFGRPFISNPKLVSKLLNNQPLTVPDESTYYTPGPRGYIDYEYSS